MVFHWSFVRLNKVCLTVFKKLVNTQRVITSVFISIVYDCT